ncbi:Predicted secreted protein [Sphingobium faniae]|nr:Predicted secreted protein [Sphingobium faniae]
MNWYAIFAIYALFWVISAFIVLPFGIRTPDETGEVLREGQADSAPSNFRPRVVVLRATILSAVLCGLYYANYVEGWLTLEQLPSYSRSN